MSFQSERCFFLKQCPQIAPIVLHMLLLFLTLLSLGQFKRRQMYGAEVGGELWGFTHPGLRPDLGWKVSKFISRT